MKEMLKQVKILRTKKTLLSHLAGFVLILIAWDLSSEFLESNYIFIFSLFLIVLFFLIRILKFHLLYLGTICFFASFIFYLFDLPVLVEKTISYSFIFIVVYLLLKLFNYNENSQK